MRRVKKTAQNTTAGWCKTAVAPVMLDQPSTSTSNAASAPKRQLEDMGTSSEESKSPVSKVSKLEKGNNNSVVIIVTLHPPSKDHLHTDLYLHSSICTPG
ncbi:hypothetical protein Pcinc_005209 [Petrolisthes cinctipes]|uniref:Uncharacterized protein n=1 Tax=Petrolisthes cinctipes TaxID=88211 RepID=A0AAE1GFN7_PETCI|nr:hypothetical protein Pcinc_005209 [Petrolisthes cinctipes]